MSDRQQPFVGYGKYILQNFQFESGYNLENADVEFLARGTPRYDDDGNIINAVIYCHPSNGSCADLDELSKITDKSKPLDFDDYYFISITSLGFPNSCSPSVTGLTHKFPKYTIKDRVNFKRQFLKEKFNIEHVYGIIGRGVGGYEVYTWACDYPDEMDFIIVSGSSYKTNGYRYVVSKCIDSIIESNDDFYSEVYSDSLSRIMVSITRLVYSNHFSKKIFQNMTNDEIDVLMEEFVDDGLFVDIYDFKLRNDAVLEYDVEDKLKNIKAKSLVVNSSNDIYYSMEYDVLPLNDLIEKSQVIILEENDNYLTYEDYPDIEEILVEFLKDLKK